jgi:hypothetical protein
LIISSLTTLAALKGLMGIADIFALVALGLIPSFKGIILAFIFFTTLALLHVAMRTIYRYSKSDTKLQTSATGFPFVTYSAVAFVAAIIYLQFFIAK